MVLLQRLRPYLVFLLSPSYCDIWYVVILLQSLVCRRLVMTWCFSSSCFNTLFVCRVIQIGKTTLISRIYHIMIVNKLKNRSRRYYSHYIIKFIGFMSIYYVINLDIVSSCMVFSNLYISWIYSVYYKFKSIKLFFFSK